MNIQFHTPSFGDEVFDLSDIDATGAAHQPSNNNALATPPQQQQQSNQDPQQEQQTQRMRGVDHSSDEAQRVFGQQGVVVQRTGGQTGDQVIPHSAYGLFFRDTISTIKQQNADCSFHELSRIVNSMWEALDPIHKHTYEKRSEEANREYMKQMRNQRQQQEQQQQQQHLQATTEAVSQANRQQQQQQQLNEESQNDESDASNDAAAQQIQMLTEAGSVQKCTRENCNKRAIINPDWEDEYCSNECVVIHCRNVFNAWVNSNQEPWQQ